MSELTIEIAEALYVGLVTDTGKFQYENTTPTSHAMAADLLAHGVEVHEIFRRLYENVPLAKLELLARVLSRVERYDDGRLTVSYILRSDYEETGADENYSEGIVDHIRALEGTVVAALVREQLKEGRDGVHEGEPARVGRRGRRERDRPRGGRRRPPPGGGLLHDPHPRGADRVPARRDRGPAALERVDGVLLVAKPAGVTSHDVVESVRRARGAKVGHAGTLDPFATGLLVVLVGRGTRLQQYMVGLPKAYRVTARLGAVSDTGDPDGTGRPRPESGLARSDGAASCGGT